MEDILEVYSRPYDAARPALCMDETNQQLIGEVRSNLPVAPGQPERWEHEYVRNGATQIFLEVEPLAGRRHVEPCPRRTRQDWARWIRGMVEDRYPHADQVVLVPDYLPGHITVMNAQSSCLKADGLLTSLACSDATGRIDGRVRLLVPSGAS